MLQLKNISKSFDTRGKAVQNLNLKVPKGTAFGFLGPNGAGKTTTVKMMVGLLFPDSGEITIGGYPGGSIAAKRITGFMSENPQFYSHLKAVEVIELVGELFGYTQTKTKRIAPKLLEKVGLARESQTPVRKFSKGMIQRLAFASALVNSPDLLILDEPLDGLDPIGRLDFKRLLLELKKKGTTIFLSSHILSDVEELCDRVAIINRGQVKAEGEPKTLRQRGEKTLEEAFVRIVRQ